MRLRALSLLCVMTVLAMPAGARAEASLTAFRCDGNGGIEAMENEYFDVMGAGACWAHLGHHTYDSGATHAVGRITGYLTSVEVQLSPPTELTTAGGAALMVEGSVDGRAWHELGRITYPLVSGIRQENLPFDVDAGGAVARFIRIRQPMSAAQGLSGYLDGTRFDAELTPVDVVALPAVEQTRPLTCASDIMERVFATHPCWFGGINRYDAPSVFHTYPARVTALTRVRGTATFLPWRSDDYTQDGGNRRTLSAVVQTSSDGVHWTDIHTMTGDYGLPIAFDVTLAEPQDVSFVRIVAERHKGYTRHPALKHVRGFIVDSSVELTG